MMTSSNGNSFRVTGHLCGEFTGHRWIPRTKASDAKGLMFSLICAWINGWVTNGEAGNLRRHRAHYDVTVIKSGELSSAHNVLLLFKKKSFWNQITAELCTNFRNDLSTANRWMIWTNEISWESIFKMGFRRISDIATVPEGPFY